MYWALQGSTKDRPDLLETLVSLFLRYWLVLCCLSRVVHASSAKSFFFPLVPIWENQTPISYHGGKSQTPRSHPHIQIKKPARSGRNKDFAIYMHGTRCIVVGLVAFTFHESDAKSVSTLCYSSLSPEEKKGYVKIVCIHYSETMNIDFFHSRHTGSVD